MIPSHPGPMSVTSALTGWSIPTVKLLFGGFIAHGLLGLLWCALGLGLRVASCGLNLGS